MRYLHREGAVICASKDDKTSKIFPALEWLTATCSHIPEKGEPMARNYRFWNRDYSSSGNHHYSADMKSDNL
jgi:hypothetical protein